MNKSCIGEFAGFAADGHGPVMAAESPADLISSTALKNGEVA